MIYGANNSNFTIPYAPCMVYLPTTLGDFWANVGKYSSTMEHMGMVYGRYIDIPSGKLT